MVELVLNDEQAELLSSAKGPVTLRDKAGTVVGIVSPADRCIRLSGEELEKINRRMSANPATFPTFQEAIERLGKIEFNDRAATF